MLTRRLASAIVGIPILLMVVIAGGPLFDAVLALALFGATAEFLLAAGLRARAVLPWLSALAAGGLPLAARAGAAWPGAVLVSFLILSLGSAMAAGTIEPGLGGWFIALSLTVYAGWLGMYLGLLRHLPHGRAWVFLAVFTTFASDTGAYAVGRMAGRHKLAPSISPSKTIEGSAGGLLCASIAAPLLNLLLGPPLPPLLLVAVGFGVSVVAQAGDLAESALKRSLNMKDAGRLVPGHGGLLDRLDSLLPVGAVLYYLVRWISP